MSKTKSVALVGTCPHCGEPVELVVTKQELKAIMKGFKLGTSPAKAELIAEHHMPKRRRR